MDSKTKTKAPRYEAALADFHAKTPSFLWDKLYPGFVSNFAAELEAEIQALREDNDRIEADIATLKGELPNG